MAILIKGMEIPKSCYICLFCDYVSARCDAVKGNPYTQESRYEKRDDFCPLVPVPEPHGRLGDLDKLNEEMRLFIKENMLSRDDARELLETIADAPTVIQSSKEG